MSGSKSKTTSNQTTNQTATTTPNAPSWIQGPAQQYMGQVSNLVGQGQPFVSGPSSLQQQAFQGAANLGAPQFSWQGNPSANQKVPGDEQYAAQINGGPGSTVSAPKGGYTAQTNPGVQEQTGNGMGGSVYDLAGMLGLQAGTAGANTAQTSLARATGYQQAGQAPVQGYQGQGYGASGPAAANSYQASGPVNVQGFDPAQAASQGYQGQGYDPTTGQATNWQAQGYDPTMGTAQGYQGQGFTASGLAGGEGYNATTGTAQTYNPVTGSASGYQASLLDPSQLQMDRASLGPMAQATSEGFTEAGLNARLNPYLSQVQDAYTADFDQTAGRTRAAQSSQAAMNGGVRNSNNAIMQAVTEGELSRARGAGVAGIRSDGFNTAAQILGQDNDRAAQTSIANAGFQNQGQLAQLGSDADRNSLMTQLGFQGAQSNQNAQNQAGAFNAGAQNDFGLANLGYLNQAGAANAQAQNTFGLANMDATNTAAQFGSNARNQSALDFAGRTDAAGQFTANAGNQANQFTAGAQNQQGLANQDARNAASQFGANANNQAASQNAAAGNQFGLANMDASNQASQFGANAQNQANQFNSGLAADTSRFNAGSQNAMLSQLLGLQAQTGMDYAGRQDAAGSFGADAQNRSALDYAGRADQAGQFGSNAANQANQFNAGEQNRSALDFAGRADQAGAFNAGASNANSQFNAGSINQGAQFNANQRDASLERMLQAGGLLGNLGQSMASDQRQNLALQADLGGQQRDIQNQQSQSEYMRLASLQQLLGFNPNNFTGQTVTGNTNSQGSGTNTSMGFNLADFWRRPGSN